MRPIGWILVGIIVLLIFQASWWAYTEISIVRRSAYLRSANSPKKTFTTPTILFTVEGMVILPDGTRAKLNELNTNALREYSMSFFGTTPDVAMANELAELQPIQIGYNVVGTDTDGTPLVEIWVQDMVAYRGVDCGMASRKERATWSMLIWRNFGAVLVQRKHWPSTSAGDNANVCVQYHY